MNQKIYKYVNTLFIVIPMTLIMSFVALIRNHGLQDGWAFVFFDAWIFMLPVAYISAFVIIPIARKLSEKIFRR